MKIILKLTLICLISTVQSYASLTKRLANAHQDISAVRNNINSIQHLKSDCSFETCTCKCRTCSSCGVT